MDRRLVAPLLFLLGLLLLSSAAATAAAGDEEPLIRQVVGNADADDNDLELDSHFVSFVQRFGKTYKDAEEHAHRLSVFKANLRRARRHQLLDPSAEHGVTKFSDLTPAEFRQTFLGLKTSRRSFLKEMGDSAHDAPVLPTDGLPEDFDWRDPRRRRARQEPGFVRVVLVVQRVRSAGGSQLPSDGQDGGALRAAVRRLRP
ncbi:hypothetical protein ACQ4PT_040672 [Festuca glaucescens]